MELKWLIKLSSQETQTDTRTDRQQLVLIGGPVVFSVKVHIESFCLVAGPVMGGGSTRQHLCALCSGTEMLYHCSLQNSWWLPGNTSWIYPHPANPDQQLQNPSAESAAVSSQQHFCMSIRAAMMGLSPGKEIILEASTVVLC